MPDAIAVPHIEQTPISDVQLLVTASVRNEQDAGVRWVSISGRNIAPEEFSAIPEKSSAQSPRLNSEGVSLSSGSNDCRGTSYKKLYCSATTHPNRPWVNPEEFRVERTPNVL